MYHCRQNDARLSEHAGEKDRRGARERWSEMASPAGPLPALRPPPLSDAYAPAMGSIPSLGEHTDAVLVYSQPEIEALRAGGLI